jgi:hypothetical protein
MFRGRAWNALGQPRVRCVCAAPDRRARSGPDTTVRRSGEGASAQKVRLRIHACPLIQKHREEPEKDLLLPTHGPHRLATVAGQGWLAGPHRPSQDASLTLHKRGRRSSVTCWWSRGILLSTRILARHRLQTSCPNPSSVHFRLRGGLSSEEPSQPFELRLFWSRQAR